MTDVKPILVTGASRGLGAAMAETLAKRAHVIAVARTTGGLEELDDRIQAKGGSATLAPMDITNSDAMAHLCRSVFDRWGGVSLWVHAAIHAPPLAPADHIDGKDLAKSIEVNVTATATLIEMVSPLLGSEGQAMFLDDPHLGEKFFGTYAASKAAQIALARAWQVEATNTGPKVHVLAPKAMPTAVRARFFPGENRANLTPPLEEAERLLSAI